MGSYVPLNPKSGILINGKDALEYHPDDVKKLIASDETGLLHAMFKDAMMDTDFPLPDDYAKEYGRPSLTEVPFMQSENDGYPYLPGHSPNCSGPDSSYVGGCWCKWVSRDIHNTPMWPGGPDLDDFDM